MTVVTPSAFAAVSEMPSVYFVGQAPGLYQKGPPPYPLPGSNHLDGYFGVKDDKGG